MRTGTGRAAAVALVAAMAGACRGTPTEPTAGPPPVVVVNGIRIVGQGTFAGPGETEALSAVLRMSDGREVANAAGVSWSISDQRVGAVSPAGVVTTYALGITDVQATYTGEGSPLRASLRVVVTPPGTFVNAGRVREPGRGSLGHVEVREAGTDVWGTTDTYGHYNLGGLTTGILKVDVPGYETAEQRVTPGLTDDDIAVQKIVRVSAGQSVVTELAPNDMVYQIAPDRWCQPCRRVRIVAPAAGLVDVQLTWQDLASRLGLWWDGTLHGDTPSSPERVTITVPVAAGETFVYLGGTPVGSYGGGHVSAQISVSELR